MYNHNNKNLRHNNNDNNNKNKKLMLTTLELLLQCFRCEFYAATRFPNRNGAMVGDWSIMNNSIYAADFVFFKVYGTV